MSRIANNPVKLPAGVEFDIADNIVSIKGRKGEIKHNIHPLVTIRPDDNCLKMAPGDDSKLAHALAGTTRSLLQNIVTGVHIGFERKLTVVGVGYRVQVQGKFLELVLGFSHPIKFKIPEGITIETPSQTEIIIKGIDKQKVGQVAADIRGYREPEPYKGKGIRYENENIILKEAKKT